MMTENARQKLRLSPHGARTRELIPPYAMVGMFPYNAHAWTVPKLVSDLERRVLAARQWLQDNHWDPLVEAFLKDKVLAEGVYMPEDPNIRHAAQMTVQEVAAHDVWTRQRVVFDIHPGLTKHLRTSDSDKFPPMVLQHLTHPNPFVYLSEPVPMKDAVGKPVRVLGWYVVGMTRDSQYTDTTDEQAHAFHLTVISEVLSEDGKEVRDWDYCRITLPINGADATVGELVSRAMDSFNWDPSHPRPDAGGTAAVHAGPAAHDRAAPAVPGLAEPGDQAPSRSRPSPCPSATSGTAGRAAGRCSGRWSATARDRPWRPSPGGVMKRSRRRAPGAPRGSVGRRGPTCAGLTSTPTGRARDPRR
jgi:hypothetical protein